MIDSSAIGMSWSVRGSGRPCASEVYTPIAEMAAIAPTPARNRKMMMAIQPRVDGWWRRWRGRAGARLADMGTETDSFDGGDATGKDAACVRMTARWPSGHEVGGPRPPG